MAEWATDDLRTAVRSNKKNVYVMDSAPTTLYEGQVWVCTSSDPPLVKVYDETNTHWMDYHPTYYETVLSGQMPAVTPVTNGTLVVAYDTDQSGTTLYARANSSWRDMGGALTRAYPITDATASKVTSPGTVNLPDGFRGPEVISSGQEYIVVSGAVTPTEDGVTVAAFGGAVALGNTGQDGEIRLYLDGTSKDSAGVSAGVYAAYSLKGTTDNLSATAYIVDMRLYARTSGLGFYYSGGSVAGVSVKT